MTNPTPTDEEYMQYRGNTLAEMREFWELHTGSVSGKHDVNPSLFDLTPAQKHNFGKRVALARLGRDPNLTANLLTPLRREVVEVRPMTQQHD